MVPITNNDDAIRAKYDLERALLGGTRQLLTGDEILTDLTRDKYELCVEWGKLIFAWWDDEHSQNWRVAAYEIEKAEVRLKVTRGIGQETAIVRLRDSDQSPAIRFIKERTIGEQRQSYAQLLGAILKSAYPDLRLKRATTGADRVASLPGRFARLSLLLEGEAILAIGVNDAESQADIDRIVAAGLIWLARFNERREPGNQAKRLWFCLPRGRSQTVIERLALIDINSLGRLGARVECFEVDEEGKELRPVRPSTQDELLNSHPREVRWPDASANCEEWRERIVQLAPHLIEARRRPAHDDEVLSINGLGFARMIGGERSEVWFGVAGSVPAWLNESNFGELKDLVHEIIKYRSADSPDRRHAFYRLREEAWLESMLRREIRSLDASLDDHFVYSQIPAWRSDDRSVIDLLTINQQRRLVVIEIKTAEDQQLPLQGLDYWLRVEQSRLRGEFEKRGMFNGIEIAARSALLYLVAPRLRFHRTFSIVARCLAPQIESYRVGVNTNWREGVRVPTMERVNCQIDQEAHKDDHKNHKNVCDF
jgi:hypothetical protein